MFALLTWSPTTISLALAAGYFGCGITVAVLLSRKAASSETVLSALALWPLLLPLLSRSERAASGPLAPRIDRAFSDLRAVLAEAGGTPLDPVELASLQSALHRADERVALVDRWIARERSEGNIMGDSAALGELQTARARAVDEIESVLAGIAQLRLQIGLLTLAGDGSAVQEHLSALAARIAALEELSGV